MKPRTSEADWLQMVEDAIEAVLQAASACPRGSAEWEVLTSEPMYLREMRDAVRGKPPGQRPTIKSRLVALSAREHLGIPQDVLDQVYAVSDIYRRWANRPEWHEGSGPPLPLDRA